MATFDYSSQVLPLPPPSAYIPRTSSRHHTSANLMVLSSTQTVDHPPFLNHVDSKTIPVWQSRDADPTPRLTTIDMDAPRQLVPSLAGVAIMQPPKAVLAPAAGIDGSFPIKRERVRHSTALGNENRMSEYQERHKNTTPKMNMKTVPTAASSLPLSIVLTDHKPGLAQNAQPKSNEGDALTTVADDAAIRVASHSLGDAPIDAEPIDEASSTPKVIGVALSLETAGDDGCKNISLVDAPIEQNAALDTTRKAITYINVGVGCIKDKETDEFVPPSTVLSHSVIDLKEVIELVASKSWEIKLMDEYMKDEEIPEPDKHTVEELGVASLLTSKGAGDFPVVTDIALSVPLDAAAIDSQTTPAPLKPHETQTYNTRDVKTWQPSYCRAGSRPGPDLSHAPPPRRRHDHRRIMQEMMEAMEKAGLEEQRRAEEAARQAAAAAAARKPTLRKWVRSVLEFIKGLLQPARHEPSKSEIISNVGEESKSSLKEPESEKPAPKPATLVVPMIKLTVCKYRSKPLLKCNRRLLHPTWLTQPERQRLTILMRDGVSRCQATRDVLLVRNLGAHAPKPLNDLGHISEPETDGDAVLENLVGDTHISLPIDSNPSPLPPLESSKSSSPEAHSSSLTLDHHAPQIKRDGRLLHPTWLTRAERCSVAESTEQGLTRRHATRELLKARGQRAARAESLDGIKDIGNIDTDTDASSKDMGDISSSCSEPDSGAFSSDEAPQSDAVTIEPSPTPDAVATPMEHSETTEELKTMWMRMPNKVHTLFSLCSAGWRRAGGA